IMVTTNLTTDLDLTNGARGEIMGVVLHPDESAISSGPVINLQRMPLFILVKMQRTRTQKLISLDERVVPIEPSMQSIRISMTGPDGKPMTKAIQRRQFSTTAAYAFTDYRAQGQTLPHVIVDIASPPSGKLTLFNLYVALSRSHGRDTIRLLRDFDEDIFMVSHESPVIEEDDRLTRKDEKTNTWYTSMNLSCVVLQPDDTIKETEIVTSFV
ncbi:hypothetical protein EW146_g10090, partial [Bondarzewia mesenterica]